MHIIHQADSDRFGVRLALRTVDFSLLTMLVFFVFDQNSDLGILLSLSIPLRVAILIARILKCNRDKIVLKTALRVLYARNTFNSAKPEKRTLRLTDVKQIFGRASYELRDYETFYSSIPHTHADDIFFYDSKDKIEEWIIETEAIKNTSEVKIIGSFGKFYSNRPSWAERKLLLPLGIHKKQNTEEYIPDLYAALIIDSHSENTIHLI